jgi:hypothetical protein
LSRENSQALQEALEEDLRKLSSEVGAMAALIRTLCRGNTKDGKSSAGTGEMLSKTREKNLDKEGC